MGNWWTLKFTSGPLEGKIFRLRENRTVIAPGQGDIQIGENAHIEITYDSVIDAFYIKDLRGNALAINGLKPKSRQTLIDGDKITIGESTAVFESPALFEESTALVIEEPDDDEEREERRSSVKVESAFELDEQLNPVPKAPSVPAPRPPLPTMVPLETAAAPVHKPAVTTLSRREVAQAKRESSKKGGWFAVLTKCALLFAMAAVGIGILAHKRQDSGAVGRAPSPKAKTDSDLVVEQAVTPGVEQTLLQKCETDQDFCLRTGVAYWKDGAYESAFLFFSKACEMGQGRACEQAGVACSNGHGVQRSPASAADFFDRACKLGELSACERLKKRD